MTARLLKELGAEVRAEQLPADVRAYAQPGSAHFDVLLALAEQLPPFPSDAQVAAFLNCSTRTLRRWRSVGLLKAIRLGDGHPRVSRGEVARFICSGTA